MDAQGLPAMKEALKGAQEKHVFLESEIKSTRDVPGQRRWENMMSSWWSQLSVAGSFAPSSTLDGSQNSSVMTLVGLPIPPSDRRTTDIPSLAQSSGLTQALQRRSTAQPEHGTEMPSWNSASSRNLSLFMTVPGRRSFSPLFTDSRKIAQSLRCMQNPRRRSAYEEYQEFASSAIGNLKIAEVDQGGCFVKIRNHATEEDENIGGYLLKQDIKGQPVAVFRFPSEIRMEPNSTVTVWAADAMVIHRFPSDLLWKDLERFRTSLDCTTILCEPSGQAVAWYTPLYWTTRQELMATGESEEPENIVIPTFSTTREQYEKEQESTRTDTGWNMADPWQTSKKRPNFIKRDKKTFASLFPNQSAWCQSPNTPAHPHFSLGRPLTMGNDGSSLCRQSRCQPSRPDPVPGTLYAGTRRKKNPSVPSCVSEKGKSQPPQLAVEEEESQISGEQ
ncbi:lamin tail domain-containing protein 1 [Pezoporus flaviventris]|uniref:lamin tail domain-containing protein 1 n=1 Tax=Pezoporus flaviventris TaxID=889875 RepID=UPI002AB10525|nr:lamin tail domain-containing protein 1 [Pezoporus flaviventris]